MLVLFLLVCVVHSASLVCGHNIKDRYNGNKVNQIVTHSKNSSRCRITVDNSSALYLKHQIGALRPKFVYYKLVFKKTTNVRNLSTVIRPNHWVWTYRKPNKVNPYLHWPVDFPILSFGLLCIRCLRKEIYLNMTVRPVNCTIAFGSHNATLAIAKALNNMTQEHLITFHQSYNNSYWCYLTEIPNVMDTVAYQFALYFNYPIDIVRYKCCNSSFDYHNANVSVTCPEGMTEKWRDSRLGPYVIGLVLLCYCPVILFCWGDIMVSTGRKIPAENQYEDLDDSDRSLWVYLDGHAPISLASIVCGLCGLAWKHPVAVSRLRRVLFVLFSPILIFLQFLLYIMYHDDIMYDLIEHGVPMGFLSMLGGIEKSKRLFVPMFGGPFWFLVMYYITGFIFLLIPRSLGDLIEKGSLDSKYVGMSPLSLSTEHIEELSMVPVNQYKGYKRLSRLLLARFYLIMMPRFWIFAVLIIWRRIKRHLNILMMYLPKSIFITLSCIVIPLNLIFGLLEICFSLIYYGIPLFWVLLVVIRRFVSITTELVQSQIPMNIPHSVRLVLRFTMYTIIGPFLLFFVYGLCTIYLVSFSFLGEILIFLFYALVMFPSSSFGYLFFGGALVYYIWKVLRGIGDAYYGLLSDLFEICTNLDRHHNVLKVYDSKVMIAAPPGLKITAFRVNDKTIKLTEEQANMIHSSASPGVKTYVRYEKHIPAIPRHLFMYVVRKSKPVHITVFQAIFRIGLIVLLVIGTMRVYMNSTGMSSEISEVLQVIFIVVIGALPRVLEITVSEDDKAVHREIYLNMLEMLIQEYNQTTTESSNLYIENELLNTF
ncbi:hypothetical protein ACJMK2_018824 [Sinanodonta woodiana]|uniref:Uncharacterized protein n=1 Tax=Sinanodonta woodiana TaxID=1069815 RepID=A0ABD3UEJ6_SINWO